jgi:hypothetical protein
LEHPNIGVFEGENADFGVLKSGHKGGRGQVLQQAIKVR